MLTTIATALAFAKRLPPWVYYAIAAIIAAGLIYRAGWNARDEKADRERAEYIAEFEQAADRARRAQQAERCRSFPAVTTFQACRSATKLTATAGVGPDLWNRP